MPTEEQFQRKGQIKSSFHWRWAWQEGSPTVERQAMCCLAHEVFFEETDLVIRLGPFHMEIWISGFFQRKATGLNVNVTAPVRGQWAPVCLRPWTSLFFYVTCLVAMEIWVLWFCFEGFKILFINLGSKGFMSKSRPQLGPLGVSSATLLSTFCRS